MGRDTPMLVDLKPSGEGYMEDLYRAGGAAAVMRELKGQLNLDCLTINGRTLGENLDAAPPPWPQNVVRTMENPIHSGGAMAVLRGNLAPDGAIVKPSAASETLMSHTGRAVVFDSLDDLAARIDSDDLDVRAEDVLVLRGAGPLGAPGMPEAGYIPIPKKLARQGVKDMVRISDARMSGTAFGTIVLHIAPESAAGGPLRLVETGDQICLDVPNRRLELLVDDAILAQRAAALGPVTLEIPERGYRRLFMETVQQADRGCDFDFLVPKQEIGVVPRLRD
jgi:dihydroxy-acid dehydratase